MYVCNPYLFVRLDLAAIVGGQTKKVMVVANFEVGCHSPASWVPAASLHFVGGLPPSQPRRAVVSPQVLFLQRCHSRRQGVQMQHVYRLVHLRGKATVPDILVHLACSCGRWSWSFAVVQDLCRKGTSDHCHLSTREKQKPSDRGGFVSFLSKSKKPKACEAAPGASFNAQVG